MAGVLAVGNRTPACTMDYRTGKTSGNCAQPDAPAAPQALPPPPAAPPPPPPQPINYNFAPPQAPSAPAATPAAPAAPAAAPSMVSLNNQVAPPPLDAINEEAGPTLREGLGRRNPPSLSALFAQLARVY